MGPAPEKGLRTCSKPLLSLCVLWTFKITNETIYNLQGVHVGSARKANSKQCVPVLFCFASCQDYIHLLSKIWTLQVLCLFEHRIPEWIRLRYMKKKKKVTNFSRTWCNHFPPAWRSSQETSDPAAEFPLNHLPTVYRLSINVSTLCSHVAILKKIYHLGDRALLSFNLWQAACRMHCRLLISLSLRSFISSWVWSPPPVCTDMRLFRAHHTHIELTGRNLHAQRVKIINGKLWKELLLSQLKNLKKINFYHVSFVVSQLPLATVTHLLHCIPWLSGTPGSFRLPKHRWPSLRMWSPHQRRWQPPGSGRAQPWRTPSRTPQMLAAAGEPQRTLLTCSTCISRCL